MLACHTDTNLSPTCLTSNSAPYSWPGKSSGRWVNLRPFSLSWEMWKILLALGFHLYQSWPWQLESKLVDGKSLCLFSYICNSFRYSNLYFKKRKKEKEDRLNRHQGHGSFASRRSLLSRERMKFLCLCLNLHLVEILGENDNGRAWVPRTLFTVLLVSLSFLRSPGVSIKRLLYKWQKQHGTMIT